MSTQSIEVKRGATFALAGFINLPSGSWTATCEAKDASGQLIAELDVTLTPPVSPYVTWTVSFMAGADITIDWPLGYLYSDVRFQDGSEVIYTQTFVINVLEEITNV